MPRPLLVTIDPVAMANNLARIRQALAASRIWAVVKASAYGHSLEAAVQGFRQADGLAVIEPPAAARLRALGWGKPILLMEGVFDAQDVRLCMRHSIDVVLHAPWQERLLAAHTGAGTRLSRVWVKANLGMNRLGYAPHDALALADRLLDRGQACGLMAHFANADQPGGDPAAEEAAQEWVALARRLPGDVQLSLANSASVLRLGALTGPRMPASIAGDWVRCGIALYGASPFAHCSAAALGLDAAMAFDSRIIAIQMLKPGDTVGYGSRFVAQGPTRIGVVAAGYADGYPRHAPEGTPVWVDGMRCPLAGRVSMDMLTVDLSAHPAAAPGSPVQLWGRHVAVDEVAERSGTIGYQLMCSISPRVARRVLSAGAGGGSAA